MADDELVELCRRADLDVLAVDHGVAAVTTRHPGWPDAEVRVIAPVAVVQAVLATAAADVDDLWPGRDHTDGALALLSTSLHAVLHARRSPPRSVTLTAEGGWSVEPADDVSRADGTDGPARWVALRREDASDR